MRLLLSLDRWTRTDHSHDEGPFDKGLVENGGLTMTDDVQRERSGIALLRLLIPALSALLATPAKAVDVDELTVVTLSRDGAWGVATAHSQGPAIAAAIRDCRAMAAGPSDCGAQFTTTRGGWVVATLCGDRKIIVAAGIREAAEQAALARVTSLKAHFACRQVLTVAPHGIAFPSRSAPVHQTGSRPQY